MDKSKILKDTFHGALSGHRTVNEYCHPRLSYTKIIGGKWHAGWQGVGAQRIYENIHTLLLMWP